MEVLDMLIKHVADTTIVSNDGYTPLDMASEFRQGNTEKHIIERMNKLIDLFSRNKSLDKTTT